MEDFFMQLSMRERYMLLAAAAAATSLCFGMLGAWVGAYWGARRGGRRAMLKALATQPLAAPQAQHSEQLARSVDTMALEIERIAEAQRFLVKLMSEREAAQLPPIAPAPRGAGSVTPH